MAKKVKQICFNAIDKGCMSHLAPGLWRHPCSKSMHYKDIEYWQNFARVAESGLFDAVFIADGLGVPDVYMGNDLGAFRVGVEVPVIDPLAIAVIGSSVTKNIGFGITAGVYFEHPFPFARRMSTLDHLTKGRIAWNIVTGYMPSAYRNMGLPIISHDERYDYADEYMEVIYKLLEGSWEDDAVIANRENGEYADPRKIHHIGHHGKHFDVPGTHLCEPSIQRTPFLFQAGNSTRGLEFATKHAEAIFIGNLSKDYAKNLVQKIRKGLVKNGRDPYGAKIFAGATIITDDTQALAEAKYNDFLKYVNKEGPLISFSGWLGVDLSKFDLDDPLDKVTPHDMHISFADAVHESTKDDGKVWTIRDLIKATSFGGQGPKFVGGPKKVADIIQAYVDEIDIDGLILHYAINPGSFEDVANFVVPELQRRGAYKLEYAEGSLRNKIFGNGDRLPDSHIGSQYRVGGPRSTINDLAESTGRSGNHPPKPLDL